MEYKEAFKKHDVVAYDCHGAHRLERGEALEELVKQKELDGVPLFTNYLQPAENRFLWVLSKRILTPQMMAEIWDALGLEIDDEEDEKDACVCNKEGFKPRDCPVHNPLAME